MTRLHGSIATYLESESASGWRLLPGERQPPRPTMFNPRSDPAFPPTHGAGSNRDGTLSRSGKHVAGLMLSLMLAGCASSEQGGMFSKALEAVGLKAPESVSEAKAMVPLTHKVTLRVHAGEQLNTDAQARSLSLVFRVYKLKRSEAFLAAPYSAFGESASERSAFGDDLIDAREVVFRPGQKHEVVEELNRDVAYLGVVALFRAPADGRWRFAFESKQAAKTGVTLGLHGCAISVAAGQPEQAAPEALRLAGVRCR
jgi:type VI secretion system protein VasD